VGVIKGWNSGLGPEGLDIGDGRAAATEEFVKRDEVMGTARVAEGFRGVVMMLVAAATAAGFNEKFP
jgi:hypothetical protein